MWNPSASSCVSGPKGKRQGALQKAGGDGVREVLEE